jgi:ABC-2 type transport system permease protein
MIGKILAVFRYELKQSFGIGTTIIWLLIILFPSALQLLINLAGYADSVTIELAGMLVVALIPGAVCLLNALMSMSSFLHIELEGNTWPYVAVRSQGKVALMFGKYLVAVTRSMAAGMFALMLMMPLTSHALETDFGLFVGVTAALVVLSSISYCSLFCLLGVIMHKRPLIMAVIYMVAFEGLISILPAVVNKITIHYYLRSMLVRWMDWEIFDLPILSDPNIFSLESNTPLDLFFLAAINVGCLVTAATLLVNKEYCMGEAI